MTPYPFNQVAMKEAATRSSLPDAPDGERIDEVLLSILEIE